MANAFNHLAFLMAYNTHFFKSVLLIISFKKKVLSSEMAHICNPITLVTGESDVQDYALIHSEFQTNLD